MSEMLIKRGLVAEKIMPVPMGVDEEEIALIRERSVTKNTEKIIGYLGVIEKSRGLSILLEMLVAINKSSDSIYKLLFVGDAIEAGDKLWFVTEIEKKGLLNLVEITGWLPRVRALEKIKESNVAISYVARGELYDCSSPTKLIECMALGIPVVGNDLPDQKTVLTESGGGTCVESNADEMAAAVLSILSNRLVAKNMSELAVKYVEIKRSYNVLGKSVANRMKELL